MVAYSSLLFLGEAFEYAVENKNILLTKTFKEFIEHLPIELETSNEFDSLNYERYFYNLLFIELVANIEFFIVETLTLVVLKHPHKIGFQKVSIAEVIELKDTKQIVKKACHVLPT